MSDITKDNAGLEEEYEPDLLTLEDEDGQEHTFEVLDAADMDERRYLAVVAWDEDPQTRLEQDAEMLIMRVGYDENNEEYVDIVEDEEELHKAGQMFLTRLKEVYDIDMDELTK